MAVELNELDICARWIDGIKYDASKRRWIVKLFSGKIIETIRFSTLAEKIAYEIGVDIVQLVADELHIHIENVISPMRNREYTDSRHVAINILKTDFNFTYEIIKRVFELSSNQTIAHAIANAENVREIRDKLERVHRAYPWIRNQKLPL